jgi:tRNA(Arg) A34 adenosine deaminase TadA
MFKNAFIIVLSVIFFSLSVSASSAVDEMLHYRQKTTTSADHEPFIRQAFALAISAAKKGNHPFGAVLVHQGRVILSAENTVNTGNDFTNHAEVNLLRKARQDLSSEVIRQSTLYTSAAPCMFCCATMWYSGVKTVVYGVSSKALAKLTDFEEKSISCDKLHQDTGRPLEWIGPILEEEGLQVFCYWPNDLFRPSLLKKLEGREGIGRSCNVESR